MSIEVAYVIKCDSRGCTRRLFREAVGPGDAFGQALGAGWTADRGANGKIFCAAHADQARETR